MRDSYAVVVAARNEERCIGETIGAILGQSLPPDMVAVIDDGSTDGTPGILGGTPGITTITNPPTCGGLPEDEGSKKQGPCSSGSGQVPVRVRCGRRHRTPTQLLLEEIGRMQGNDIVMTSGSLAGERPTAPMDAGRMIGPAWFGRIGCGHAENFGDGTRPAIKARVGGRKTDAYSDLTSSEVRMAWHRRAQKNWHMSWRASRALGLSWHYAIRRFTYSRSQAVRTSYSFMRGRFAKTDAHGPEVGSLMKRYQNRPDARCSA